VDCPQQVSVLLRERMYGYALILGVFSISVEVELTIETFGRKIDPWRKVLR